MLFFLLFLLDCDTDYKLLDYFYLLYNILKSVFDYYEVTLVSAFISKIFPIYNVSCSPVFKVVVDDKTVFTQKAVSQYIFLSSVPYLLTYGLYMP